MMSLPDDSDYPPEVIAELVELLEWFEAHPGGRWEDMQGLFAQYQRWKDVLRGTPSLLDNNGTTHIVPGLSGYGRIFLAKHRPKAAETVKLGAGDTPDQATKGKRIDERMLARIRDNREAVYWSSIEWAQELKCAKSTIIESKTWKTFCKPARERERLARGRRLRDPRKKKASDSDQT